MSKKKDITSPCCRNIVRDNNIFNAKVLYNDGNLYFEHVNPDERFNCIGPYPNINVKFEPCKDFSYNYVQIKGRTFTKIKNRGY